MSLGLSWPVVSRASWLGACSPRCHHAHMHGRKPKQWGLPCFLPAWPPHSFQRTHPLPPTCVHAAAYEDKSAYAQCIFAYTPGVAGAGGEGNGGCNAVVIACTLYCQTRTYRTKHTPTPWAQEGAAGPCTPAASLVRPPTHARAGPHEEPVTFVGRTHGHIVPARGPSAFGWDPVFEPVRAPPPYSCCPALFVCVGVSGTLCASTSALPPSAAYTPMLACSKRPARTQSTQPGIILVPSCETRTGGHGRQDVRGDGCRVQEQDQPQVGGWREGA